MRRAGPALIGFTLALAAPLAAQDVGGVFDMGQLTTTLATDHVTQSERARAARSRAGEESRRAAYNCAVVLPRYRARMGAGHAKIRRFAQLCRTAGHLR